MQYFPVTHSHNPNFEYLIVISSVKYCRREVNIYVDCYGIYKCLSTGNVTTEPAPRVRSLQIFASVLRSGSLQNYIYPVNYTTMDPGSAAPEIRHMQAIALCSQARSSLQYVDCMLYRVSLLDD